MWISNEVLQIWNTEDKKNRDRAYISCLFPQIMHHALWFDGYVKANMLYLMIMQTHGIKKNSTGGKDHPHGTAVRRNLSQASRENP